MRRRVQNALDILLRDVGAGAQEGGVVLPLEPSFVQHGDAADCGFEDRWGEGGARADGAEE